MSLVLRRAVAVSLVVSAAPGFPDAARAGFLYGRLVPQGAEPNGDSTAVDVSSNGRTVVFSSAATNWGPLGSGYNGDRAVAVDLDTGVVEIVSVPPGGSVFRGEAPAASGDGRYVAFLTYGSSYGPNWQVLRKDRRSGALEVASATAAGQPADRGTDDDTLSISADGRYVAFETASANFGVPAGTGVEIFVKDMASGQVEMASVKSDGNASDGRCELAPHALSDSGRYLAMVCSAAMVPGATAGQAYVRDLQANTTELVSRGASAASGSSAFAYRPALSPSGRFVSFQNRGYGGLGYADGANIRSNSGLYLRDRQAGTTTAVPRPSALPSDDYDSCNVNAVSDVGSLLLTCAMDIGQPASVPQVFLYVPGAGAPALLSVAADGRPGGGQSGQSLAVNASGLSMAFESKASDIDPEDGNGKSDVFVLVDESVISETIFADGFEAAPGSGTPEARTRLVPLRPGDRRRGPARD